MTFGQLQASVAKIHYGWLTTANSPVRCVYQIVWTHTALLNVNTGPKQANVRRTIGGCCQTVRFHVVSAIQVSLSPDFFKFYSRKSMYMYRLLVISNF